MTGCFFGLSNRTCREEVLESLGGVASGDDVWAAPDGGSVPIVRYVWHDVSVLASSTRTTCLAPESIPLSRSES